LPALGGVAPLKYSGGVAKSISRPMLSCSTKGSSRASAEWINGGGGLKGFRAGGNLSKAPW
jgi:hypothetical protein